MCQSVIGRVLNQQEIEKKVVFEEHDRKLPLNTQIKRSVILCLYVHICIGFPHRTPGKCKRSQEIEWHC